MRPAQDDFDANQKDGHFQNYADYSRTLRAWLVAYGVGGPVLLLSNEVASKRVASSKVGSEIIVFFLLGVALQIVLALLNKWGAWHMYVGAGDPEYQQGIRYSFWALVNKQSWIDFTMDVASIASFMWATWRVFGVLLLPAVPA